MKIVSASLNLSALDKSKIQKLDKEGNPFKNGAMYYNVDIILNDEPNQFGQDCSISTAQTKEEREVKAKRNYIGNGKTVWNGSGGVKVSTAQPIAERSAASSQNNDDLPF